MAGFVPMGKGEVHTSYHEGEISPTNRLKLYVCTYAVGHLAFQVVAQRQRGFTAFAPRSGRGDSAVPFWPEIPQGFIWPAQGALMTVNAFEGFSARWQDVSIKRFSVTAR